MSSHAELLLFDSPERDFLEKLQSSDSKLADVGSSPVESISDEADTRETNETLSTPKEEQCAPGTKSAIKHFYRENAHDPWDAWVPDDLDVANPERSTDDAFALVVRQETNVQGQPGLALHSITIQSPYLRELMKNVFQGYRGIATQLSKITFIQPFHEFVYRWHEYERESEQETEEIAQKHRKLFHDIIEPEIRPHLKHKEELFQHGIVSHAYLWTLFPPDCDIFTTIDGCDRMFQLVETWYRRGMSGQVESFHLACRFVNFNGQAFGFEGTSFDIPAFEGYKMVNELDVRPIHYLPGKEALEKKLQEQGELFERYTGFCYVSYSGFLRYKSPLFGWRKEHVDDSRVVVDVKLFETRNPDDAAQLQPLNEARRITSGDYDSSSDDGHWAIAMSQAIRRQYRKSRRRDPRVSHDANKEQIPLSDYHRRLCTPIVSGYCLSAKCWARFNINQLRPIEWNHFAFDHLILPHDYKTLLLAFVSSHVAKGADFDDVIKGKGRGMIVLLHGDPGVGKTLTAEAVTEKIKKPLYSMSAGELKWDAHSVETNLKKVLEVCTKWKAVLLIDECDVYLEKRTVSDLQRNELVSVFLRLLEYYQGVLFLTTNRVETFDPAFKSRIDLNIQYPALDTAARRGVWETFTTESQRFPHNGSSLSADDLDQLATLILNGREIKNLVKAGRLLSQADTDCPRTLAMSDIRTVLRVQGISITGEK